MDSEKENCADRLVMWDECTASTFHKTHYTGRHIYRYSRVFPPLPPLLSLSLSSPAFPSLSSFFHTCTPTLSSEVGPLYSSWWSRKTP